MGIDGIEMNRFAARWYDPVIARWHAPDPLEQMHSPYVALCGDPANFVDPDGRAGIHLSDWDNKTLLGFAGVIAGGAELVGIGKALQGASGISQVFQAVRGVLSAVSTISSGLSLMKSISSMSSKFGVGSEVTAFWQNDLMGEIRSHSGVGLAFKGTGNKSRLDGDAANKDSNSKKLGDNPITKEEEPNEKILFRIDTYGLVRWIKEKILNDPAASETFHHGFKIVRELKDKWINVIETQLIGQGSGMSGENSYYWEGKGIISYRCYDPDGWSGAPVNGIHITINLNGKKMMTTSPKEIRANGIEYTDAENRLVAGSTDFMKEGVFEIKVVPTSPNVQYRIYVDTVRKTKITKRVIRLKRLGGGNIKNK